MDKVDYPLNLEVSDASKSVIKKIQEAGGSIKLIHRTPLKLREHIYPNKYPLPLADPITPWWKVQKLLRK
jgi:large subunit ribosomal protein L15